MLGFYWSYLYTTNIWSMLSCVTQYCLIKFLGEIMSVISSLLNHKSSLYPGTVDLWVTARVLPFPLTFIFFPTLVIFSTRSEFHSRSIVEHLSNNMIVLGSNLISLVYLCLNKTSLIIFKGLIENDAFYFVALLWFGAPLGNSLFPQTGNVTFINHHNMNQLSQILNSPSLQFWYSRLWMTFSF